MFKKLTQKLKSFSGHKSIFDPSCLGDPLAMQTDWTPAKKGGANFRTHKLVQENTSRLEFRASFGAKLFYLIFLLAGLGVMIGVSAYHLSSGEFRFELGTVFPIIFGLLFAVAGGCMFYFGTAPIVFDKLNGFFWKGRQSPEHVFDKKTLKHFAELEEIHALQLISERCRGDKSTYYSYELNLVLEDSRRINVVDHGNAAKLREDTATLSEFLDKPIWDAIDF